MNPALDLSSAVDEVVAFTKLRCSKLRRDPGGGGINVARVVNRLGGTAKAFFPVGGPVGLLLERLVREEGIEIGTMPIPGDTREDFTVFETMTGKQFRFVTQGPELPEALWHGMLDAFVRDARGAAFAVISGSLPIGVPEEFFAIAARALKAAGVKLALDTTGAGLRAALAEGVALVKPNHNEFAELVGVRVHETAALALAARDLLAHSELGAIALSLAEEGAILATREHVWRAQAPRVKAVSTVGAGDSFLGAMVWSLTEGHTWPDALRLGVAAGSAALLSPGTDLARPDAIKRLAGKVEISEIC